jgi:3-oxoacyl-[acyl-carrier-protein] synthase II
VSGAVLNRVAITGLGVICSMGSTPDAFFASLMSGKAVMSLRKLGDADEAVCATSDFDPSAHFTRAQSSAMDRFTQLALVSARHAWRSSCLADRPYAPHLLGVCWGTGFGGAETVDAGYSSAPPKGRGPRPGTVPMAMSNAAASHISIELGLRGPTTTYSVACASSAVAIGEAFRLIRHGYILGAIAGGSEALLTRGVIKAWQALKVLAKPDPTDVARSCRPFDAGRSGLVLGEGAAAIVLENLESAVARGGPIVAELVGYGVASDASHLTAPSVDGQVAALRAALADGRVPADRVQYINAHAAGTPLGDRVETEAVKHVFGSHAKRLMMSSTKSMHGHTIGAAGAIELLATILATVRQAAPPTANLRDPDAACDLDYVPLVGREHVEIEFAASNSFAFGGTNAVLLVRRWSPEPLHG